MNFIFFIHIRLDLVRILQVVCQHDGERSCKIKKKKNLPHIYGRTVTKFWLSMLTSLSRKALSEVNEGIEVEKERSRRLALLAAKSWILRKKLYAALHDPYISALSEVEDEDIFDGLDDEDLNEYDSLFDDSEPEPKIEDSNVKRNHG